MNQNLNPSKEFEKVFSKLLRSLPIKEVNKKDGESTSKNFCRC